MKPDRDVDVIEIGGGMKNITMTNCRLHSFVQKADGSIVEKHQRLNPKTMKWEDRKSTKRKR